MVLSERVWKHISERHPEVSTYRGLVLDALAHPDLITRGKTAELKAIKRITEIHLGRKYVVVVYREEGGRKAIITAYFTSSLKKIKGDVVWKA